MIESFRVNIPLDKKQVIEDTFESTLCHELLEVLDPKMGDYFHKNDKRKIVNCLFRDLKACEGSGTTMSQVVAGQDSLNLRYNPVIIWIKADKSVLEKRIRKRVDKMIDQEDGLREIRHVFGKFT